MKLLPLYIGQRDGRTRQIIKQCLRGSAAAQRSLFDLYYSDAMHVALRYSNCYEDAQEILSDAFIRAFRKLNRFDLSKPFLPWLMTLIIHASSDYYRYKHQWLVSIDDHEPANMEVSIIDDLSYQEMLELIQKLPHSYRTVFNLSVIEGYKHREIAALLGISEGTSKSHLSRARHKLQIMLAKFTKYKGLGSVQPTHQKEII